MHVPYWIKGVVFALVLVSIVFFLKVICPLDVGCFVDPFLVTLFSPTLIWSALPQSIGKFEPIFILSFWVVVGAMFGYLYSRVKTSNG